MSAATSLRSRLARPLGAWVHEVDGKTLRADGLAGLLGAVLVLPQGIAFAALAGLPPAMGWRRRHCPARWRRWPARAGTLMSGPTNATALALGAMLLPLAHGDASLAVPVALALTLLVGVMQVALALARLGALANFISPSVMLGFTTGAAGLIAWYALAGILGASGRASPLQAWGHGLSWPSIAVGALTLVLAMAGRRWWRRGRTCWWLWRSAVGWAGG